MVEGSQWQKLPDELSERILVRLSIPSILAGRCVCRQWRSLLSSASFAALWADDTAPRDAWFLVHRLAGSISAFDPRYVRWVHLPAFYLCGLDPAQTILLASAGGLLCFRDCGDVDYPTLTVCNPLSRARRVLPRMSQIQHISIVCMTAERATDSYVILVTGTTGATSIPSITEVYDSRTGRWVKDSQSDKEQCFYWYRAVWHEGSFYSLADDDNLIAYNLGKHKWMNLRVELSSGGSMQRPSLLVSGGKLLLVGKLAHGVPDRSISVFKLTRFENCFRWNMVDIMPLFLFNQMYPPFSSVIGCQGHNGLICFSANWGFKLVLYDVLERKWLMLLDTQGQGEILLDTIGRNNQVGLPYEPSFSARV